MEPLPIELSVTIWRRWVLIPAGEFEMGDPFNEGTTYERPVHTVFIDDFYIDVYEVTNAMYAKFLNAMGKHVGGYRSYLVGYWRR